MENHDHVVERARERLGIELGQREINEILKMIKDGKAKIVQHQGKRKLYKVFYIKYFLVVYQKHRLVTVMNCYMPKIERMIRKLRYERKELLKN